MVLVLDQRERERDASDRHTNKTVPNTSGHLPQTLVCLVRVVRVRHSLSTTTKLRCAVVI